MTLTFTVQETPISRSTQEVAVEDVVSLRETYAGLVVIKLDGTEFMALENLNDVQLQCELLGAAMPTVVTT